MNEQRSRQASNFKRSWPNFRSWDKRQYPPCEGKYEFLSTLVSRFERSGFHSENSQVSFRLSFADRGLYENHLKASLRCILSNNKVEKILEPIHELRLTVATKTPLLLFSHNPESEIIAKKIGTRPANPRNLRQVSFFAKIYTLGILRFLSPQSDYDKPFQSETLLTGTDSL